MNLRVRLVAGAMALALVASCGNDKSAPSPLGTAVGTLAKAAFAGAKARKAGAGAQPAPIPRAEIEKYNLPILRAVIASRGADALLTISDTKSNVVTWSTTDGTTFTLRDGVLIQTRGLGPDLMSAQAPGVAQLAQNGSTYQRAYFFLGANDQSTRRTYDCSVTVIGRETIEIFQKSHDVTHVTENCVRPQGNVTNEFWIEGAAIRKSRQWTSGLTGYIDFERVVD